MYSLKNIILLSLIIASNSSYSMEIAFCHDYKELFDACEKGDLDRVKNLSRDIDDINQVVRERKVRETYEVHIEYLSSTIPVSVTKKIKDTLLGCACEKDHFEIVQYLVEEKKADIHLAGKNPLSVYKDLPFEKARSKKVKQYLFECGADPHLKYLDGKVEDFFSFDDFEDPLAVAHELINNRGYDVNKRSARGTTQLMRMGDNAAVAECFIKAGARVNVETNIGLTSLFHANQRGNYDVGRLLLAKGARLTVSDNNRKQNQMMSLMAALYYGNLDFFNCFLREENIDINMEPNDCTILHDIAAGGSFSQLEKAGVRSKKVTDLSNKTIVMFALSKGADSLIKAITGKLPFEYAQDDEIKNILKDEESARKAVIEYKFENEKPLKLLKNRELTGHCRLLNYKSLS